MKISLLFCFVSFISSCINNNTDRASNVYPPGESSSMEKKLPDSLIIAPIYPDTIFFVVQAELRETTRVKGNVEGFKNRDKNIHELYFQRFVGKQGRFRVIHCVGTSVEIINDARKEENKINRFNDTIKFDELGYFAGEPGDPVNLIPLYPRHAVKIGEYWSPAARVKIPMGHGIAQYKFVIDSVCYYDDTVLARMTIEVNANLEPSAEFKGGKVTIAGGGTIIWNCTIHQRMETHIKATYLAIKGAEEVEQIISVDDKLEVHKGKRSF